MYRFLEGEAVVRFSPKTEAEIERDRSKFSLWPKGSYDYEITDASDEISSKGNDMIKLTLKVVNDHGDSRTFYDYLLEAIAHKLRHCAEAANLADEYDRGDLRARDFIGTAGRCIVGIEKGKGDYQDKNNIVDYEKPAPRAPRQQARPAQAPTQRRAVAATAGEIIDDTIPF